ncbi:E3 ubiquitin-protein ligase ARIH2-like isoform X1 [Synchiropus splendidus]|uniref:E3 ubiquitin-protein ligase ARIH2-like isoform X1 n=1 Tax=Synchiropus splendidus TaxID=270530 RepID=UPI00237DA2B5|nr:E3 ubiquitin-protein ligase ARIH2-like isoform X1 [Synchiropus splendidus]XP_053716183.1 E3 ubiquitin-protein ligase ARIH2-like isoform X1 [Synchiropus splendidus]
MGFWNSKPAVTNTTIKNTSTETPTRTDITRTAEEKCYDPKDPNLEFVEREDEMDVLCVNYKSPRALMSCGHSVTPMSLTSYCRHLLEEGRSRFVCAVCEEEWSFQEVQKMALLTPQEADDFEKVMWENYKEEFEVKSCPGCKSSFLRTNLNDLSVKCTVCSAGRVGIYIFCWQCLREWRGPAPRADRCDNEGCNKTVLETLKNCPDIVFQHSGLAKVTGCPSVRACPTCGVLVEHNSNHCKSINCDRCKVPFCFICLKMKEKCYATSSPYTPCCDGVAPRQSFIPARQKT